MHRRVNSSPELLSLALAQSGVVSRKQVALLGLGRESLARLLSAGQWRRLDRGVYFVLPTQPDWLAYAWAGVLLGGPQARLGGLAAARLHGLTDAQPRPILVMVPDANPLTSRDPWIFRRERPGVRSSHRFADPARLCVEDTVLDLCEEAEAEEVVGWITKVVQQRLATVRGLRQAAASRRRLRHRAVIMGVLDDVAEGAESFLEIHYLRDVERAHGLPAGTRQHRSRRGRHYRDVRYDDFAVIVELDGRLGHSGMGRFRDMHRDNLAVLQQEVTLRYGTADVLGRPCEVASQVAEVLISRGWRGLPTRCPRCRFVDNLSA